jgi:hypothetical protein
METPIHPQSLAKTTPGVVWPSETTIDVHATRFTLFELLVLLTCAGFGSLFSITGSPALGCFFLLTVVCFRTPIVDLSVVGGLATGLTMLLVS